MVDSGTTPVTERPIQSVLGAVLRVSDGLLDLLPIATFICDARGTILQYNRHAVALWGRAPQPGQTHEEFNQGSFFFELDGSQVRRSMVSEVLATGKSVRDVERIVERPDGSSLIVSVNIDPLRDAKGNVVGAVNCFLDITERKRMDNALERSRLQALEQEQRFAATYEHAAIGISEIAPDGRFLRVNEAICAITGFSREHLLANTLFTHTHPDDADPDRQAFVGELVEHVEHPELPAVMGAILDKVVGPHVIAMRGAQADARPVRQPQTTAFGLLLGDFQSLASPDPLDPLVVHQPAGGAQQGCDLAVAVAAILSGKLDDVGRQPLLVVTALRHLALRRAMLAERRTGATLGDAKLTTNMLDAGTPTRRAQ